MKKWKIVFGIAAFLFFIQLATLPFGSNIEPADFVALIIGGLTLMPLYGYAYDLAIGNKLTSILIFSFNSIGVAYITYCALALLISTPSVIQAIFSSLGIVLMVLFIYPQYRYAFKSEHLWGKNA